VKPEFALGLVVAVENFRGEIETVGPHDGAGVRVDANLSEVVRVVERLQEGSAGLAGHEPDVSYDPVVEEQPHDMRLKNGDADD
jgi:hypothetical protein